MVWKGSAGKKVGFGVKGTTAVAWYCPKGNDPDDPSAFEDNVCKAGCKKWCEVDTVNTCYNQK
jgi:hypothetical protein